MPTTADASLRLPGKTRRFSRADSSRTSRSCARRALMSRLCSWTRRWNSPRPGDSLGMRCWWRHGCSTFEGWDTTLDPGTRVGRARPVRGPDRFLSGRRRRVSAGAPGGDRGPRRHRARGRDGRARTEGTRRACSTFPRRVASLGFGRFRRSFSKIRVARLFHPLLRVRPRAFARAEPPRDPALRRRAHRREHVAPGVPGARGREGRGGSRSGIPPRRRGSEAPRRA